MKQESNQGFHQGCTAVTVCKFFRVFDKGNFLFISASWSSSKKNEQGGYDYLNNSLNVAAFREQAEAVRYLDLQQGDVIRMDMKNVELGTYDSQGKIVPQVKAILNHIEVIERSGAREQQPKAKAKYTPPVQETIPAVDDDDLPFD